MVEGAVLVAVDVEPAGQAVEGHRADAHVQVGAGIGVEQVAARIDGTGTGVVCKDVAGLGDERIARHLDADLVGLARAQTRERGLGADGRGLADVGRAAGLAELGGLAPAGAAAGHDVAGVTRVVVDLGRRTVGVVDAHARVDGRGLDGLQVVGAGIEARGRVAAIERARDIGRAIAHEGQDVDHVGDVDLPQGLAHRIEGDIVMEGLARLDLLFGDGLLQHEARGRVDGDGGVGRLGAGLEAARGGVELAVRISINGAAADHGLVAQGCAVGQCQCQLRTEGDVGQVGATFQVGTHVRGDVRVGPGQAGETLRGGVLFHPGLDGLAALAAAGGHIAHPARQHVGDGDGAGVGRQHGGVARVQLEGECGAGRHGLGGVGRLDDPLGDAGGGARLRDLQVVTQLGVHVPQGGGIHVVGVNHGTIADDAALGDLGTPLAKLRAGGLDGDALRPGLAQLYSVDVQVGAFAAGQAVQTSPDIGEATGSLGLRNGVMPGDAGAVTGVLCVLGAAQTRVVAEQWADGAVSAGKGGAGGANAVLDAGIEALSIEFSPEVLTGIEGGAVDDVAQRQIPVGHAALIVEAHPALHVLTMSRVVNNGISRIARVSCGPGGQGQGQIRAVDLAGIALHPVGDLVRERIIAGTTIGGRLPADGSGFEFAQGQLVLYRDCWWILGQVGPEHNGLVGHPVFVGWNGFAAAFHPRGSGQRGVHASQADADGLVVRKPVDSGYGGAVAAVGDDPVAGVACPRVAHTLVNVDGFTGQKAGTALPDTAAAVGKAAGRHVVRGRIVFRAPVVQSHRLGIAADIQGDFDGLGGIKLLDAFSAVAVGVAGQEAHQHAVVEAVLAVRAPFTLKTVGLGVAVVTGVDHHIVGGRCTDGQRRGLIGSRKAGLSDGTHFQGGGGQLGTVAVRPQNRGGEVAGIGAGPGVVGDGADHFLAIG